MHDGIQSATDINNIIEAQFKSALERIYRRTRTDKKGPKDINLLGRVVPKKKGNNDPNQHRGKRNYRGSQKKKLDNRQLNKFAEAVEFVGKYHGKPISECVESLCDINDIEGLEKVLTRMLREPGYNNDWTHQTKTICEELKAELKPQFLRDLAHGNESFAELGRKYSISRARVTQLAAKLGIERRVRKEPSKEQVELVVKLFNNARTYKEVCDQTGLIKADVKRIFQKLPAKEKLQIRQAVKRRILKSNQKKQITEAARTDKTIKIECRDPEDTLENLLRHIKSVGNAGHSFKISVDPEDPESQDFYWDGDGSDHIGDIQVGTKEDKIIKEDTHTSEEKLSKDRCQNCGGLFGIDPCMCT